MTERLYRRLAVELPNVSELGGVYLAIVQPRPAFAKEYNRWYDRDEFYSGAMSGPWIFSGRRWVATRTLRGARILGQGADSAPYSVGNLLATYFITAGHVEDARTWMITHATESLWPDGRGFPERDVVYSGWHDVRATAVLDPPPMTPEMALEHPYEAIVIEVIDAVSAEARDDLVEWLANSLVPATISVGQCVLMTPTEADAQTRAWGLAEASPHRVTLAWFLPDWDIAHWPSRFALHESLLRESGRGSLVMVAPFLPVVPGTDRYIDEL